MQPWKEKSSEILIDNKWLQVYKKHFNLGNGHEIEDYYTIAKNDFVVIVAEIDGKLLLLEQFRPGVMHSLVNLPMGFIEQGEDVEVSAKRECVEETGYEPQKIECIGQNYISPSFSSVKAYVFYATDLVKKEVKVDVLEGDVKVLMKDLSDVKQMVDVNVIHDASTLVALSMYFNM